MSEQKQEPRIRMKRIGKMGLRVAAYILGYVLALGMICTSGNHQFDSADTYTSDELSEVTTTVGTTTESTTTSTTTDTTASVSAQSSYDSTELTTTTTTTTTAPITTTRKTTTTTTTVYEYVWDGTRPVISDCTLSDDLQQYIYDTAESLGVDYYLVMAVIKAESGFNPKATNGICHGLMALHNCNASYANSIGVPNFKTDPYQNVYLGIHVLANFLAEYSMTDSLICYNMGEYGARNYLGGSTSYSRKVMRFRSEYIAENAALTTATTTTTTTTVPTTT